MRRVALALCASMVLASLAMAGEPEEIPDALYPFGEDQKAGRYPAWVAADKVLTPAGTVDPALFAPSTQYVLGKYLRLPAKAECIRLTEHDEAESVEGPDLRPDLASAVRNTGWVFTARVTGTAPGFNGHIPNTLLQLVPEEVLKGPKDRSGAHYVFLPVGTVQAGTTRFCKTNSQYPDLPKVGERVLLLVDPVAINRGKLLFTDETGILTIHQDDSVSLPLRYQSSDKALAGKSGEELLKFVRQVLQEEE